MKPKSFDFETASIKSSEKYFMPFGKIIFLSLCFFILNSCTEPYALQTNTYQEVLVVEATITNEFKNQEITLSVTTPLEVTQQIFVKGAEVIVSDNQGNKYNFVEIDNKYISKNAFQAFPDRDYKLIINTKNGQSYESTTETLSAVNPLKDVTATVETKDSVRGVAIHVDSFDPTGEAKYYRYEYEETYKIIAPKWVNQKTIVLSETTLGIIPNPPDTKVCYSSDKNTDILLANTSSLTEDKLHYLVRFISDQNYIISHRYSILVHQYIENLASYNYYATLRKISGSGSILSPIQPGFVEGNLKSIDNPNEKVVGYFDVASVSSKRIYFNYDDLFPFEPLPPYYTNCDEDIYPLCFAIPPCRGNALIQDVGLGKLSYQYNEGILYHMVLAPCGDCTSFSSNIKPLFWED